MIFKLISAALLLVVLLGGVAAEAGLIVNEVMANEPGGSTSLEWFELYNDSSQAVSLAQYQIQAGSSTLGPFGITVQPFEYVVFCRKLFSDQSSPGFEGVFGNNSGIWGDSPYEEFGQPAVVSFTLANNSGTVTLYLGGLGTPVSSLGWTEAGRDGASWERVSSGSNTIEQSIDFKGGTPGFINSVTPVAIDLSLDSVMVWSEQGLTHLLFRVANRGALPVSDGKLTLYYYDPVDPQDESAEIVRLSVPPLGKDSVADVEDALVFDSLYVHLGAVLSNDYKWRNNRRDFVAPAKDYPAVRLSEILANPDDQLFSEWIELKNIYDQPVDLSGWKIGDAVNSYAITTSPLVVGPGDYIVLVEDSLPFLHFYADFSGKLFQPADWPVLNNGLDIVKLVDTFGIEAGRFGYLKVFDRNYTWSRSEQIGTEDQWGRSETPGGSPGKSNRVVLLTENASIKVSAEPRIFSPDGDGIDEVTTISLVASDADEYVLKVYDRQGRAVKTFIDGEQFLRSEYIWDGRSDGGDRLPIGIYIIYFEIPGVESTKTTVVIAR